jgi:hypothetical protein
MLQLADAEDAVTREERERCPECGHVWEHDEPVHFADCRYFTLDDNVYDEEEVPAEL